MKFERLHFYKHFFNSLKGEELQHIGYALELLFDFLFFRLVANGRHDVREYRKLVKVAHFDTEFKSQTDLITV